MIDNHTGTTDAHYQCGVVVRQWEGRHVKEPSSRWYPMKCSDVGPCQHSAASQGWFKRMVQKTADLARKLLFIILDLLFNIIDETYTVTGMKMVGDKGESVWKCMCAKCCKVGSRWSKSSDIEIMKRKCVDPVVDLEAAVDNHDSDGEEDKEAMVSSMSIWI